MQQGYKKPLPVITADARKYWEGCKEKKLLLQKCNDCETIQTYPRTVCYNCLSSNLGWVESSGRGIVYSYTIQYSPASQEFIPDVPYVVAMIELPEGIRMLSNIVGCPVEEVKIGMPVAVVFEDVTPEVTIPKFKPAGI